MIEKSALLEETKKVRGLLDKGRYPETYAALSDVFINEDTPFIIASNLMECDKPKDLPPFVIEYITALYQIEISEGNHHAMNNLGGHYYGGGRGFEQNFSKAMELYNMAAENGNRQAQENLGYCYYYGRDTEVDYEKAFHYFALGAFDGHLISLYKIGDMYRNGYYVKKNEKEAFLIYKHCIDVLHGGEDDYLISGPVRLRLGDMYLNGIGTKKNPEAALVSYSIAEIDLFRMVKDGDYMYKKSLRAAIEGQERARAQLAEELPEQEWTFDDRDEMDRYTEDMFYSMPDAQSIRRSQIPIRQDRFKELSGDYFLAENYNWILFHHPGHFLIYDTSSKFCILDAIYEQLGKQEDVVEDNPLVAVISSFVFNQDKSQCPYLSEDDAFRMLVDIFDNG